MPSTQPHPGRTTAIVTDGLWRKSLSAIRSLGNAGFDVAVMGDSLFTTGFWSGFTTDRMRAPTAEQNSEAFGKALDLLLDRHLGSVLLPMEDASLRWVSDHREELAAKARFLIPPREGLAIAWDKAITLQLAQRLGLPCPHTSEPKTALEFAEQALNLTPGSFVTKPRTASGSAGITYGEKRSAGQWESHWRRFGPMLIQERLPPQGRGQGVSVLIGSDGECVAAFAHERLHQYPNSGGPSTDRRSIYAPALIEQSLQLLKRLEWRGVAMVEWKVDPRDGQAKLMEINPRFWGSLELAVRSGVDFPLLYARAALGEKSTPVLKYAAGIRCRWLLPGEILRYLTQPKGAREGLLSFLRGLPESAEEWNPRDLLGTLATLLCTAAVALNPRYWKYVRRG